MYVVILTTLFALLCTFLDVKGNFRHGMKVGFILLTVLGVIHYDYGNDYMPYYHLYDTITRESLSLKSLLSDAIYKEKGWVVLCHLFSKIGGFFMMVAVLNIIQNTIIYRFIKSNVRKDWWVMAVFIYTFTTSFYLLNFSMMRQGFVVCVFLGLWHLIENRRWLISLLVLYLCSFVHSSAIILLPFAFWGYLPVKKGKIFAIIIGCLFSFLWLSGEFLNSVFEVFMNIEEFSDYNDTYSLQENNATYGLGFILGLIPLFIAEYYLLKNQDSDTNKRLVLLSSLSFVIMPFAQLVPLIGRIATYFSIYRIASIPIIYRSIKKGQIKFIFVFLYVLLTVYAYWMFFNYGIFAKPYQTFHTIFEVL